ncbi:MAG: TetR/AcrR family transcriptional regulator [Deltaproteobacteria bacterium]|nr:TetR/AcrR family transcriptional regulator [Deltaproteobacteria bacterium]
MSNRKTPGIVPAPIWAHPAPGARRPKLTREQLAACALRVGDTDGIDAVSMRRVAEELGVGTMTLYYYVRTKDDLLSLMEDALMAEVLIPDDQMPTDWRAALRAIAFSTRGAFMRHPWVLTATEGLRFGPNSMKHVEQSMAAVASVPGDLTRKLAMIAIVDDFVAGHVARRSGTGAITDASPGAVHAIDTFVTAQLATGAYPQLRALIGEQSPVDAFTKAMTSMSDDALFEFGLEALLDGFARAIDAPAGRAPSSDAISSRSGRRPGSGGPSRSRPPRSGSPSSRRGATRPR